MAEETEFYTVKNLSKGARGGPGRQIIVQSSARGRIIQNVIPAGQERTLPMSPGLARRYAQIAANSDGYMSIAPKGEGGAVALGGEDTARRPAGVTSGDGGAGGGQSGGDGQTAEQELLARADGMPLDDLRTEAKLVLGTRWPRRGGGELDREAIKELLAKPAQE